MYSETVEPTGDKKKMFVRTVIVLLAVGAVCTVAEKVGFYPGMVTLLALLGGAVALFGQYKKTFIRYTYIYHDDTLYIDRRVGSVDTVVEEVRKEDIEDCRMADIIPEGERRVYTGEGKAVYALSHSKGTFYFSPSEKLLSMLL